MPTITSITYRPKNSDMPLPAVGYLRVPLTEASLIEGLGIEDDFNAQPRRNLNVMDRLTLGELDAQGFPTFPGALGENLVLDGIDLRTLPAGTRIRLGPQAMIAISAPRTGCDNLHRIDERMPAQVAGQIGVMAQVVQAGRIKVGDRVEVIESAQLVET
jgi:MOSC domain-containing protein YiiM